MLFWEGKLEHCVHRILGCLWELKLSHEIWNNVVEKCEMKLARWKSQYLSRSGRLTLINSVLDSLPTYMMSVFPIPKRVINRLDKIRRKSLWQGNNERRLQLVSKKEHGDLGIKNFMNQTKPLG
ncbi:hypothetical protein H5410_047628 [Solanum commersonii]|uniref:Uncharacterized protein n=1 Tax=Solanum commersonii TaxID=4109 RepID=A0A9J5XHN6_SOLCO|nr:hypothetical protein H5410_047628 [Solanum commersonii]